MMKIAPSLRLDSAGRLILLRQLDPIRKWESLDDRCCHKFISGRQIEVTSASGKPLRLVCPTTDCFSSVRDWVYPNEIAQPSDALGRRVLRVIGALQQLPLISAYPKTTKDPRPRRVPC